VAITASQTLHSASLSPPVGFTLALGPQHTYCTPAGVNERLSWVTDGLQNGYKHLIERHSQPCLPRMRAVRATTWPEAETSVGALRRRCPLRRGRGGTWHVKADTGEPGKAFLTGDGILRAAKNLSDAAHWLRSGDIRRSWQDVFHLSANGLTRSLAGHAALRLDTFCLQPYGGGDAAPAEEAHHGQRHIRSRRR